MRSDGSIGGRYQNAVLFSILALCWGTSFVAIEIGLEYVPPLLFAGFRYAIAGVLVFGYAAVVADRAWPSGRTEWLAVVVAGTFVIALYHGLLYVGELYVAGAVAATIVSTAPILTAAFAGVALPAERLTPVGIVGFVLGLLGVAAVAQPWSVPLGSGAVVGATLVFAAAAAFALGTVLVRPIESGLPIETLQAWAMLVGGGLLLVWAPLRGERLAGIEVTTTALLSFGYLTLVSSVFAFFLYFELLDRTGATQVSLVGYAEPVVAMGVSWVVLDFVADALTMVGLGTILAGFVIVKRNALRRLVRSRFETDTTPGRTPNAPRRQEARTDGGTGRDDAEPKAETEPDLRDNASAEPQPPETDPDLRADASAESSTE
ncbi:DMT family transporter [Halosolutus amylolyticus]|uniref:DMT family transporter n=1 Tax=Halosolutus amylolyticus TaxID=2932267 RepID=A0ABD5PP96_9EURY|nr:DMT family transporter [Halosolutus amylolyticus]